MNLVKWNPIREMDDLLSRFVRGTGTFPAHHVDGAPAHGWAPAVDISETSKEYLVRAELPGIDKQQVKVHAQDGILTISGERKPEGHDGEEQQHRIERYFGPFSRSFSVPNDVLEYDISAECRDGLVTVHLLKSDFKKAKPQEITVH